MIFMFLPFFLNFQLRPTKIQSFLSEKCLKSTRQKWPSLRMHSDHNEQLGMEQRPAQRGADGESSHPREKTLQSLGWGGCGFYGDGFYMVFK